MPLKRARTCLKCPLQGHQDYVLEGRQWSGHCAEHKRRSLPDPVTGLQEEAEAEEEEEEEEEVEQQPQAHEHDAQQQQQQQLLQQHEALDAAGERSRQIY